MGSGQTSLVDALSTALQISLNTYFPCPFKYGDANVFLLILANGLEVLNHPCTFISTHYFLSGPICKLLSDPFCAHYVFPAGTPTLTTL